MQIFKKEDNGLKSTDLTLVDILTGKDPAIAVKPIWDNGNREEICGWNNDNGHYIYDSINTSLYTIIPSESKILITPSKKPNFTNNSNGKEDKYYIEDYSIDKILIEFQSASYRLIPY